MNPSSRASSSGSQSGTAAADPRQLCAEFEAYPFSDDPGFRAGLPAVVAAIRGHQYSPADIDETFGRAQWYYFTRLKGVDAPWETYVRYAGSPARSPRADPGAPDSLGEARRMLASPAAGDAADGTQGMSFALLCQLISEGRAGEVETQQVPEGLNAAQPSSSTMAPPAKPWEASMYQPNPQAQAQAYGYYGAPYGPGSSYGAYGGAPAPAPVPDPASTVYPGSSPYGHALANPQLANQLLYTDNAVPYLTDAELLDIAEEQEE